MRHVHHLVPKRIRAFTKSNVISSGYRRFTAPWRAVPNFVILGANGAGTTSFFINLIKHPEIAVATDVKEIHFFDRHYENGENWYRSHFPYRQFLARKNYVTGEATPAYLFFPYIAQRASRILPQETKFIILLRNPVTRAYGHYHHQVTKSNLNQPFSEVIRLELESLKKGFDYPTAIQEKRSPGYLLFGLYAIQIRSWFEYFPRENFLIIKSEDYFKESNKTLGQVAKDFLGLSPWELNEYTRANQNRKYPPMDETLYQEMNSFFEPFNRELYHLTNINFDWK